VAAFWLPLKPAMRRWQDMARNCKISSHRPRLPTCA